MARNFRIQTSGSDRTFFFDLIGDFDGSSAFELLNLLQEKVITQNHKAYVNTSRLKSVHPFGCMVFNRNFQSVTHANVVFTGRYAPEIAPLDKIAERSRQNARRRLSLVNGIGNAGQTSAGVE